MSTKIYDAYTMAMMTLPELDKFIRKLKSDFHEYIKKTICVPEIANIITDLTQGSIYKYACRQNGAAVRTIAYWCKKFNPNKKYVMPKDFDKMLDHFLGSMPILSIAVGYSRLCEEKDEHNEQEFINTPDDARLILYPDKNQIRILAFGRNLTHFLYENASTYGMADYHYQDQTDRPAGITKEQWSARHKTWKRLIGPDFVPINHGIPVEIYIRDNAYDLIIHNGDMYSPVREIYEFMSTKEFQDGFFEKACETIAYSRLYQLYVKKYLKDHPDGSKDDISAIRFFRVFQNIKNTKGTDAYKKIKFYERKLAPYRFDMNCPVMQEWLLDCNTSHMNFRKLMTSTFKELLTEFPELVYEK